MTVLVRRPNLIGLGFGMFDPIREFLEKYKTLAVVGLSSKIRFEI